MYFSLSGVQIWNSVLLRCGNRFSAYMDKRSLDPNVTPSVRTVFIYISPPEHDLLEADAHL